MNMKNDFFEVSETMSKSGPMSIKELGNFKSYKDVLDFVPRSVWDINARTKEIKEMFVDDLEKHTCKRTESGCAVSIIQKYSVFNPLLGMNILKIYSNINDVVLDPFAGRDRALITNYMERHYIGYEISPKTFTQLNDKIKNWKYRNDSYNIDLYNSDGTKLEKTTECVDFIFSCPPYWNKEIYEDVSGQISSMKNINDWKNAIYNCGLNCKRLLKSGKYVAIVISDIRNKSKFIPLHSHWIEEFENAGLVIKDVIINKTNPMNYAGINGYLRNKIMWKTHEYVLIFKK